MELKLAQTKKFAVNSGSSEDVLTQMVAACEAIWQETHFESMVHCAIKQLQSIFQVSVFSLLKLEHHSARLTCETVSLRLSEKELIDAKLLQGLRDQLCLLDLQAAEVSIGLNRLVIHGQALNFILLGDREFEWFAFVWLELLVLQRNQVSIDQLSASHYSHSVALEFIGKQLQMSSRWLSRYSETQNLLQLDDLTGLFNQRYLEQAIEQEIKRAQRYESSFCLLFIDLDDFKSINDNYGHLAGSQVLKEVAQILKISLRDVDLVFRYGGDEFVILLIESDAKGGVRTAQRIRERIQLTPFTVSESKSGHLTASIGVAAFPEHAQEKTKLLILADECMYASKRHGKNQVILVGNSAPSSTAKTDKEKNQWDSN